MPPRFQMHRSPPNSSTTAASSKLSNHAKTWPSIASQVPAQLKQTRRYDCSVAKLRKQMVHTENSCNLESRV